MARSNPQTTTQPDGRRRLGAAGEQLACQALEGAGLTILTRNWRCARGEIDIVAQEEGADFTALGAVVPWLVLVEVRTRRGAGFGTALQSLTPRKQAKLREVAAHYVQATAWPGPWRIDVVAVQMDGQGRLLAVEHIRHAVGG
ncbi:MAG TPA: YraN family protein [Caldilineaceae bacterium]|nr:YraN family protein [Caldilineaceae bacterium]